LLRILAQTSESWNVGDDVHACAAHVFLSQYAGESAFYIVYFRTFPHRFLDPKATLAASHHFVLTGTSCSHCALSFDAGVKLTFVSSFSARRRLPGSEVR